MTSKTNKLVPWAIGILIILMVVAFVGKRQGWIGQAKGVEVMFAFAERRDIVEKVSASGEIQPEIEVKISPDVAGEIIELRVEEGDSVKLGERLIKIRPDNFEAVVERSQANLNQQLANLADARAKLSRAQAQFERTKLEYERNEKLRDQKVISDVDYEVAEVNFKVASHDLESAKQNVEAARYIVQSARASVDEANENLRLTDVVAPMTGIVSRLSVEQGERVVGTQQMAGTEMLRIADLSRMEVLVDVNENDIVRIQLGDTALIEVDAYTYLDVELMGVVHQIANTANPKASSDAVTEFQVRIKVLEQSFAELQDLQETQYPLKPGMTASVEVITDRKEDVVSIPLSAVTLRELSNSEDNGPRENQSEVVFVNEDFTVDMRQIQTGISDFEFIEVVEGLGEDEEVVSGPFQAISSKLSDGDRVEEMELPN